MTKMLERRRSRRLDINLPVTLRHKGKLIPATTINLSCGGTCIITHNVNLRSEGSVEICLDLDRNYRDVSLRGEVLRIEKKNGEESENFLIGVKFTKIFSAGHDLLQQFLNKNL